MLIALGQAFRYKTWIVLDIVHDVLENTRRLLIESRLDQHAAGIGSEIRKNRTNIRKEDVRIV